MISAVIAALYRERLIGAHIESDDIHLADLDAQKRDSEESETYR